MPTIGSSNLCHKKDPMNQEEKKAINFHEFDFFN